MKAFNDRAVTQMASAAMLIILVYLSSPRWATAQSYDVLKECMALSGRNADIHLCLDNYLDAMDSRIASLVSEVEARSSAESLSSFQRAQEAFIAYRRTNCLWYLDFSTPRRVAEQLAKACLARMSGERMAELQRLLEPAGESPSLLNGLYVYGASQNAFRPCGSESRYWVEGRNTAVSQLQQDYLDVASAPLQVLHVTLRGELDETARTSYELDGVLRLQEVVSVRVPLDSDCRLIESTLAPTAELPAPEEETVIDLRDQEPDGDVAVDDVPEQELIGYFGAWQARCTLLREDYECSLQVDLEPSGTVTLIRKPQARTEAVLSIPGREIDTPARIRWQVDEQSFGDIADSSIRVDNVGTRQLISADGMVQGELLTRMIEGLQLEIDIVASVDDDTGDPHTATLRGLTRALVFADDFIAEGS